MGHKIYLLHQYKLGGSIHGGFGYYSNRFEAYTSRSRKEKNYDKYSFGNQNKYIITNRVSWVGSIQIHYRK